MEIGNPWDRGSMTFTNKWAKPSGMKMDDWLKSPKGRTWVSKRNELPSSFIFRVLKDMEKEGSAITDALFEELKNDRK